VADTAHGGTLVVDDINPAIDIVIRLEFADDHLFISRRAAGQLERVGNGFGPGDVEDILERNGEGDLGSRVALLEVEGLFSEDEELLGPEDTLHETTLFLDLGPARLDSRMFIARRAKVGHGALKRNRGARARGLQTQLAHVAGNIVNVGGESETRTVGGRTRSGSWVHKGAL
jgi:hypothetical protein